MPQAAALQGQLPPPAVVPITTPKSQARVSYTESIVASATPLDINYGFTYQDTEQNSDYHTDAPKSRSTPMRQVYQSSSTPAYRSNSYRNGGIRNSATYKPTTYRTSVSLTSSLRPPSPSYNYQRTEKPQRVQVPLPLLPTLSPITFSSPAPFTLSRHVETKRFTNDHHAPRIVISASASVSDATGRRLNYSLGTIGGTSEVFDPSPPSYDDYKEEDVSSDPFYHDVPKVKARIKRSATNDTKPSELVKDEEEAVDILKFLFEWYANLGPTTQISVPLKPDFITEINQELNSAEELDSQEVTSEEVTTEEVTTEGVTESPTTTEEQHSTFETTIADISTEASVIDELVTNASQEDSPEDIEPTQDYQRTTKSSYVFFTHTTNQTFPEQNTEDLESNLASPTVPDYIDDNYEPDSYQIDKPYDKSSHDNMFGSSYENGEKWHDPDHSSEDFTLSDRTPNDYSKEFKKFLGSHNSIGKGSTSKNFDEEQSVEKTTRSSLSEEIRAHEAYLSTLFAPTPTRSSEADLSRELSDLFKEGHHDSLYNQDPFGTTLSFESTEVPHRFGPIRSVEDEIRLRDARLRSELGITLEAEKPTTPTVVTSNNLRRARLRNNKPKATTQKEYITERPVHKTTVLETFSTRDLYWGETSATTESTRFSDGSSGTTSGMEDKTAPINIVQSRQISSDSPKKVFYNEYVQKATYDVVNGKLKGEGTLPSVLREITVTTEAPEEPTTSFQFVSIDVIKKHFTMNETETFGDDEPATDDYHSMPGSLDDKSGGLNVPVAAETTTPVSITTAAPTTTSRTPSTTQTTTRRGRGRSRFREPTWNSINRRRKVTTTTTTTTSTTSHPTTETELLITSTATPTETIKDEYTDYSTTTHVPAVKSVNPITRSSVVENTTPELGAAHDEDLFMKIVSSIESTTNSVYIPKTSKNYVDDFWSDKETDKNDFTTNGGITEIFKNYIYTTEATTGLKVIPLTSPKPLEQITLAPPVQTTEATVVEDIFSTLEVITTTAVPTTLQQSESDAETVVPETTTPSTSTTTTTSTAAAAATSSPSTTTATTTSSNNTTKSVETSTQPSGRRRYSARYRKPQVVVPTKPSEKLRQGRRKGDRYSIFSKVPSSTEADVEKSTTQNKSSRQRLTTTTNTSTTTTTTTATTEPLSSTVSVQSKLEDVAKEESSTLASEEVNKGLETTTSSVVLDVARTESAKPVVPLRRTSSRYRSSTVSIDLSSKGTTEASVTSTENNLARSDIVPVTDAYFSKSVNPTQAKKLKDSYTTTPLSNGKKYKVQVHKNFVFNCFDKEINKFYSDPRDCRLFHYCTSGFSKNQLLDMKFVCDLGTYYDDVKRVCTKNMPERCL